MNSLTKSSAYHGPGFKTRRVENQSSSFQNSEYRKLKDVVLFVPDATTPTPEDPDAIQHLRPIDFKQVNLILDTKKKEALKFIENALAS